VLGTSAVLLGVLTMISVSTLTITP
jgi:hypothetical protein